MGWTPYGEILLTADFSNNRVYQPVIFNSNYVLKAVRTWIVAYNDPAFTNLQMKIYSNNAGSPGALIHTSTNSPTKAEIITLANGVKEIPFEFNSPVFKGTDTFHFVLTGSGYTGTNNSHIAWRRGFPDPYYRTNVDMTFGGLGISPFAIYMIGSAL